MAAATEPKKYTSKGHRYATYGRAYYLRTREKQLRDAALREAKRTPEQREAHRARRRELSKQRESVASRMWRHYGVRLEDYERVLAEQGGHCALCERRTGLCIDHDHTKQKGEPGFFRGILCRIHNRSIGNLGDNEEGLLRAIEYLRRPTCQV